MHEPVGCGFRFTEVEHEAMVAVLWYELSAHFYAAARTQHISQAVAAFEMRWMICEVCLRDVRARLPGCVLDPVRVHAPQSTSHLTLRDFNCHSRNPQRDGAT